MILNFIIECCKYLSLTKKSSISPIVGAYIAIGPCFTITGIILSFRASNEIRHQTQVIGFIFCALFGSAMQIFFIIQRKLFLRIINRVLGAHSDYPDFINKNMTKIAEKRAEEKSTGEIFVYTLTSSLWIICPYLYLITKPGISLDHPDVQTIPYYYSMWKTDTILSFTVKKCIEVIASAAGLGTYFVFTVFITYTVHNLETHSEEINRHFNNIIETHFKKYKKFEKLLSTAPTQSSSYLFDQISHKGRKQFEKSIDEQFIKIIAHHNFIHRYMADVTELLHKPMTAVFAWYLSSTVLFTYTLKVSKNDVVYFMKMLSLVIHCNVAFLLYCKVADLIHQMNEKIMDSFYNTSWYHLKPKSRKYFCIILALCQKKYKVKCFGMYTANLNLFIFAVRIVYSVLNVTFMVQKRNLQ